MIYEIVDNSNEEQYFSLGFWKDEKEAIKAFDDCEEPADFGSPIDYEDFNCFELREHHNGWGSFYNVIKKVEFAQKYDEEKDEYIWVKS